MRIPTNYGPEYTEAFAAIYPRVAKSEKVDLMPFLLEGVGGIRISISTASIPMKRGSGGSPRTSTFTSIAR